MNKIRNILFYPLLFLSVILIAVAVFMAHYDTRRAIAETEVQNFEEPALNLTVRAEGPIVTLSWNQISDATGFNIIFLLNYGDVADEPHKIDVGYETEATFDFDSNEILDIFPRLGDFETIERGVSFHVLIESYGNEGETEQSNVEYVLVGADEHLFGDEYGVMGREPNQEAPSGVSDQVKRFPDYVLTVNPSSLTLAVAETKVFTPSGGTGYYTGISSKPSIGSVRMDPDGKFGHVTAKAIGPAGIHVIDILIPPPLPPAQDPHSVVRAYTRAGGYTFMKVVVARADKDIVSMSSVSPAPGSTLEAGSIQKFSALVNYNLKTRSSADLAIALFTCSQDGTNEKQYSPIKRHPVSQGNGSIKMELTALVPPGKQIYVRLYAGLLVSGTVKILALASPNSYLVDLPFPPP